MSITYNDYGWPLFNGISAISPSNISKVLSYLIYGKVPKSNIKYANLKGNNIETALLDFINTKSIAVAISNVNNYKQKKKIIGLCHWFSKKFPNVELISYQKVFMNEPYACISDFELKFKQDGKHYLIDLKTSNKKYANKLLEINWDIQFYLLNKCSNLPVYVVWVTEEKILNKLWEKPTDYNIDNLINYLLYLNSLDKDIEIKKELLIKYLEKEEIKWQKWQLKKEENIKETDIKKIKKKEQSKLEKKK